ncbi:MAG TPA: hypothetical protein VM677_34770 [Actinokineospora sp.]|nr:hypothetical protein [Actinokineospora sp.]
MTATQFYPSEEAVFERILGEVKRTLQTDLRLPEWPFRSAIGNAEVCQFSLAIEGPFGAVLQSLVDAHGDASVSLSVLDPNPNYYRDNYGSFPAFTLPGQAVGQTYWEAVAHEPGGDPTGSVAYTANVVGIAGSTGAWAVWAERSWDLAIVLSQRIGGAWASCGVTFVPADAALADFTEPDYKVALPPHERAMFLDNIQMRGTL